VTIGSFLTAILTISFALGILFVELVEHGTHAPRTQMGGMMEHVILFAALVLPAALFRPRWMFWLVPLACIFAIGMELLRINQSHVHGYDVIADIFGIVLVTVTVPLLRAIGAFIASSWE
jgi:hypothetical protein